MRLALTSARGRILGAALLLALGCSQAMAAAGAKPTLDPNRATAALVEAQAKRAKGARIWCVPFARTASGVDISGNAKTWWDGAKGRYDRGQRPAVGSVMAFRATRKMPMGHVAVVSEVVSERRILIDHANWRRNQVSLKMAVIDVSERNDWTAVRVESQPESFGDVYPVNGFIYPRAEG